VPQKDFNKGTFDWEIGKGIFSHKLIK